jgi:uncharacterized protein (TIGR03083 family)
MSGWNAMTYEGRDTLLRVLRHEAEGFFALVEQPSAWEAPTACTRWHVRDIVGHLVDVTESYFTAFDAARSGREVEPALGMRAMAEGLSESASSNQSAGQAELVERLRVDFAKATEMFEALGPDEWTGLQVPHMYMGPLPAFFYPVLQLMDYSVHSWDIRQGTGRAHGISGDAADLLVPFMLGLWRLTAMVGPDTEPFEIGIRVTSGHNACDVKMRVTSAGLNYGPAEIAGMQTILEFDPGSLVLTAFGRCNAGSVRGDTRTAERFLNLFFRV